MADSEVSVRVRIKDALKSAAEAKAVAEAVDDIGDKAKKSMRELRELDATALASRGIALLASQGRDTASSLADAAGGIHGVWKAAIIAAPGITALSGGLVALAGSAGAAMLGGGIVAGGGISALIVGLGTLGLVAKGVGSQFKAQGQALNAYNLAVAQYGHGSLQAVHAQARLNALLAKPGGLQINSALLQWRAFTSSFARGTADARGSLAGLFGDALGAGHALLPTLTSQTNANAAALRNSLGPLFGFLGGGEARGDLAAFGGAFRSALSPLGHAGTDGLVAVLRIFRAGLPYVVQFAHSVEHTAADFRHWSSDGQRVNSTVGTLVGHLKSWLNLGHALGAVMYDLLAGGAKEGKSLVDSLAGVVWHFDKWLDHKRDTGELAYWFHEMGTDTRIVGDALVTVAKTVGSLMNGSMPGFTAALGGASSYLNLMAPRLQAVEDILRLLGPLAGPVTEFFLIWKTAGLFVAGIDQTITTLGRLRGALFGVAEAEAVTAGAQTAERFGEQLAFEMPGTIAAREGLFTRLGRGLGTQMGTGVMAGLALYIGLNLPHWTADVIRRFANWVHPGSVQAHGPTVGQVTDAAQRSMAQALGMPFYPVHGRAGIPHNPLATGVGAPHYLSPSAIIDHFAATASPENIAIWLTNHPGQRAAMLAALRAHHRRIPAGASASSVRGALRRDGGLEIHVTVPVHIDGKPVADAVAKTTRDQVNRR